MKIEELFKSWHKWVQGTDAQIGRNIITDARNKRATCWCLRGAVRRCYPEGPKQSNVFKRLRKSIVILFPDWKSCFGSAGDSEFVVEFNDDGDTKFADVLKVVKHAKV